eukprot:TRINITY_DN55554_c0_g1_i2.p1 TRINITY_DN55554_c0_g1~~TRINITY_DN55554_c0_g1_i2.p1  ORF type:complete len:654 (+),score=178.74 TRINITY_DN55554_c0_g1_i2:74-2035(+)
MQQMLAAGGGGGLHDASRLRHSSSMSSMQLGKADMSSFASSAPYLRSDISDLRTALGAQQRQLDEMVEKVSRLLSTRHAEILEEVRRRCEKSAAQSAVNAAGGLVAADVVRTADLRETEGGMRTWMQGQVEEMRMGTEARIREMQRRLLRDLRDPQDRLVGEVRGMRGRLSHLEEVALEDDSMETQDQVRHLSATVAALLQRMELVQKRVEEASHSNGESKALSMIDDVNALLESRIKELPSASGDFSQKLKDFREDIRKEADSRMDARMSQNFGLCQRLMNELRRDMEEQIVQLHENQKRITEDVHQNLKVQVLHVHRSLQQACNEDLKQGLEDVIEHVQATLAKGGSAPAATADAAAKAAPAGAPAAAGAADIAEVAETAAQQLQALFEDLAGDLRELAAEAAAAVAEVKPAAAPAAPSGAGGCDASEVRAVVEKTMAATSQEFEAQAEAARAAATASAAAVEKCDKAATDARSAATGAKESCDAAGAHAKEASEAAANAASSASQAAAQASGSAAAPPAAPPAPSESSDLAPRMDAVEETVAGMRQLVLALRDEMLAPSGSPQGRYTPRSQRSGFSDEDAGSARSRSASPLASPTAGTTLGGGAPPPPSNVPGGGGREAPAVQGSMQSNSSRSFTGDMSAPPSDNESVDC